MQLDRQLLLVVLLCLSGSWCRGEAPTVVTNAIGMNLAVIPAGEFQMGSPEGETGRDRSEYPHRVRITKPFCLGVYEVTQGEYLRVMGANPSKFSARGAGKEMVAGSNTSRFPVEMVAWDDAVAFCRKLSALPEEQAAGRVYRLPTEAEWEYACRAGTATPFHFGAELNGREANCKGTAFPYGSTTTGPFLNRTAAVGSYAANAFGLHDMHGNVSEWCQDWFGQDYYRTAPTESPPGPPRGSARVHRGGCWYYFPENCRSAARAWLMPSFRNYFVGFRVAANPPLAPETRRPKTIFTTAEQPWLGGNTKPETNTNRPNSNDSNRERAGTLSEPFGTLGFRICFRFGFRVLTLVPLRAEELHGKL